MVRIARIVVPGYPHHITNKFNETTINLLQMQRFHVLSFALEQVLIHLNLREEEAFFWSVHIGAEIDLVFQRQGRLWGVEVKYHEAPAVTRSMRSALSELDINTVLHPSTACLLERKIVVRATHIWRGSFTKNHNLKIFLTKIYIYIIL